MQITLNLKKRFCKDMSVPIGIYEEPYFTSRLKLYDPFFNTIDKYENFLELLNELGSEKEYFKVYNKLKDDAINYLGSKKAMKKFKQEEDMNKYVIKNKGYPKKDIYKETFDGKIFVSIDMKKANFTAIKHYDSSIVGGKKTYEDFIRMFTKYEYFINSKYIRQVIFGNHNPRRQTTYERYLMDKVLTELLTFVPKENIAFFSNDEIIIDLSGIKVENKHLSNVIKAKAKEGIDLRVEVFELRKIPDTKGYVKKFLNKEGVEFKCLNALVMPFVLRAYLGESIREEDKVFIHEGRLAKLIEVPNVEIV